MVRALCDIKMNISSLEDIAFKYGYENYDSFIRTFKKTFKVSPKRGMELDVNIVYRNIAGGLTAPIIEMPDYEYDHEKKLDFQDIYYNKYLGEVPAYIISIDKEGKDIINLARNMGFRNEYISHVDSQSNEDDYKHKFILNSSGEKSKNNICFIFNGSNNLKTSKDIKQELLKHNVLSVEVTNANLYDSKVADKSMFEFVELVNNKNINDLFFKNALFKNCINESIVFKNHGMNYKELQVFKDYKKTFLFIKSREEIVGDDIFSMLKDKSYYIDYYVIIDETIKDHLKLIQLRFQRIQL